MSATWMYNFHACCDSLSLYVSDCKPYIMNLRINLHWLVDWLIDRSIDWLTDWLIGTVESILIKSKRYTNHDDVVFFSARPIPWLKNIRVCTVAVGLLKIVHIFCNLSNHDSVVIMFAATASRVREKLFECWTWTPRGRFIQQTTTSLRSTEIRSNWCYIL